MVGSTDEVAAVLGAGRWTTFRRVTAPLVAPSLLPRLAISERSNTRRACDAVGTLGSRLERAFSVTAKSLTITGISIDNKVYDRTTSATVSGTAALSGVGVLESERDARQDQQRRRHGAPGGDREEPRADAHPGHGEGERGPDADPVHQPPTRQRHQRLADGIAQCIHQHIDASESVEYVIHRAPYIVRTNKSLPAASAPNQNCSLRPP